MKHTHETLSKVVAQSESLAEVLRKLGIKQAGGSQAYIKKRIVHFDIDTSHFKASAGQKGLKVVDDLPLRTY